MFIWFSTKFPTIAYCRAQLRKTTHYWRVCLSNYSQSKGGEHTGTPTNLTAHFSFSSQKRHLHCMIAEEIQQGGMIPYLIQKKTRSSNRLVTNTLIRYSGLPQSVPPPLQDTFLIDWPGGRSTFGYTTSLLLAEGVKWAICLDRPAEMGGTLCGVCYST